jgi:hypothetical protein
LKIVVQETHDGPGQTVMMTTRNRMLYLIFATEMDLESLNAQEDQDELDLKIFSISRIMSPNSDHVGRMSGS